METERRFIPTPGIEVREGVGGEARGIAGLAAVYNAGTVIAGQFEERIAPGAFDDALEEADINVVGLFNHDSNYVLGRTKSGTMALRSVDGGLEYEIPELPKSRADVLEAVRRGDVEGNSFSFSITSDEDEEWTDRSEEGKLPLRVIKRVGKLYDVGPVTFPAYGDTEVSPRAEQRAAELRGDGANLPDAIRLKAENEELKRRVAHLEREVRLARAEQV